jgi:hypothetical protein
MRMDERIRELREHLPEFLVENAAIYGILSKGLHELEEKQCLEAFATVRVAIEVILDERLAADERNRKITTASRSINDLNSALTRKAKGASSKNDDTQ